MTKKVISFPDPLLHALEERGEEDDITFGAVVREACLIHVSTDPTPKQKLPEYEGVRLVPFTIRLPEDWVWDLGMLAERQSTPKRKMSGAAVVREVVRVALGKPEPPKVERVARDPKLSSDIIIEAQADAFMEMRNLRNNEKEPEKKWWEWVRENPESISQVCDCEVTGCKLKDYEMHKHLNRDLLLRADKLEERYGRTT